MSTPVTEGWYLLHDGSASSRAELRAAISRAFASGVTAMRVTNVDAGEDPLRFWHDVASGLGSNVAITEDAAVRTVRHAGTDWMDVRYEPSRQDTFRHASVEQPLHSDGAHVAGNGGFALMYMATQASRGGETMLLDAETIARVLQRDDAESFRELTTLPIHMALPPGDGSHDPVLALRDGRWSVRWNYYRVVPGQGEAIESMRERFAAALARMADSPDARQFLLGRGDALVLDDSAVLHGRRAFSASERSDRLMWKTYFER